MLMADVEKFSGAIACLKQTLCEGRKTSNIDIELMFLNISRCETIVTELQISEQNPVYNNILLSVVEELGAAKDILHEKIKQLKEPEKTKRTETKTENASQARSTATCMEVTETGSSLSSKRDKVIEALIVRTSSISFQDVIGLSEAKQSLCDAVVMPLKYPQLFQGGRQPWKRILLYGPPGTGKSRLAHAISSQVSATFYCVSSTDLMSSYFGESEKLIKELFHHANSQPGKSVIFIDEIDSLCRKRSSSEDEGSRRIKTELLIQMDGASSHHNEDKLFLLCATNCPWDLDTAFLRRFQKRIFTPLPDKESRIELMQLHSKGITVNINASQWQTLAEKTEGYSGSDLSVLTVGALYLPMKDLYTANHWVQNKEGKWEPSHKNIQLAIRAKFEDFPADKVSARAICFGDFLQALDQHPPTVTSEELMRFSNYTSSFSQTS